MKQKREGDKTRENKVTDKRENKVTKQIGEGDKIKEKDDKTRERRDKTKEGM